MKRTTLAISFSNLREKSRIHTCAIPAYAVSKAWYIHSARSERKALIGAGGRPGIVHSEYPNFWAVSHVCGYLVARYATRAQAEACAKGLAAIWDEPLPSVAAVKAALDRPTRKMMTACREEHRPLPWYWDDEVRLKNACPHVPPRARPAEGVA